MYRDMTRGSITRGLLLFALLRAGRVLRFVSTSVMGGFISGICCASSSGIPLRCAL